MTRRVLQLFTLALLVVHGPAALAHDYMVYRGLRGLLANGCITGPEVNEETFRIDRDGLSTLQDGTPLRNTDPYRVGFLVTNVAHHPPQAGDVGAIDNFGHWTATYTPLIAPHHWSLILPSASKTTMKRNLVRYAEGHITKNPNYIKHPPYCEDVR